MRANLTNMKICNTMECFLQYIIVNIIPSIKNFFPSFDDFKNVII